MDNRRSLQRIADLIQRHDPDIVGVQEVDRNRRPGTDYNDQLRILGNKLNMETAFGVTIEEPPTESSGGEPRQYGIAVLSPHKIMNVDNQHFKKWPDAEPRTLLETRINVNGTLVPFYNTHLGLSSEERLQQAYEIRERLEDISEYILVGDFNARPNSNPIQVITEKMVDVFDVCATDDATFPTPYVDTDESDKYTKDFNAVYTPNRRIDYVFVSSDIEPLACEVIHSVASDHSAILVDLQFPD